MIVGSWLKSRSFYKRFIGVLNRMVFAMVLKTLSLCYPKSGNNTIRAYLELMVMSLPLQLREYMSINFTKGIVISNVRWRRNLVRSNNEMIWPNCTTCSHLMKFFLLVT